MKLSLRLMNRLFSMLGVAATLVLSGCAAPQLPPLQTMPERSATQSLARGVKAPIEANHMTQYLRPDASLVYTQSQGGSLAVGLLAGPLGVLANIKNIENNTMKDMDRLRGRVALDPPLAFRQALATSGVPLREPASPGDVTITPWVVVARTTPETVEVSARLLVEPLPGTAQIRQLPVHVHLPVRYGFDEFATLTSDRSAALQAEITSAYVEMLRFVATDTRAVVESETKILISETPKTFQVYGEVPGSLIAERDGQVWVRMPWGILAAPTGQIKYKVAQR
jgi:hypothetical protein